MECVICGETKSKEVFNCDDCKNLICKSCGGLSGSEVRVLELRGKRVMKFHCPRCLNLETFKLLQNIIDSKNANIEDKNEIISMLKAQIEEIKESNKNENIYECTEKSYAGVTSKPAAKNRFNVPNLIIRPKQIQAVAETKEDIIKKINPSELNIGIGGMRATGNGNIIIKCPTKREVEDLKKAAEGILQDKYEITTTTMMKPKIKIPGYEGNETEQQIEQIIRKQNEWINDTDEINVTYVKKKKNKESTILAECSGAMFQKCMKYKKVHIGWNRCPIYEDLSITRCFKCQEFYHKNDKCRKNQVCEYCAGNHEIDVCEKAIKKCNNCLEANKKYKLSYCVSHATSDPGCPSFKYHLEILKSKIEYN